MIVNFLPYYCSNYDGLKNCLLTFKNFTEEDLTSFVKPFIKLMDDGTHDVSENLVILTDYYLIKAVDSCSLNDYFDWLSTIFNISVSESNILKLFKADESLEKMIKNVIGDILG